VRRRILAAIVALTAIGVVVFAVPLGIVLANLYREEEVVLLERAAGEATEHVPTSFPSAPDHIELPRERGDPAIALYDRSGLKVTGPGPRHADRAVKSALHGDAKDTEERHVLIVSLPLTRNEKIIGAIRVARPVSVVNARTRRAVLVMIAIGTGAIGVSALIGLYESRRLARPVDDLARAAERLGDGDFTVHNEPSGIPEIDAVSTALDSTAARLDRMLTRERTFSEDASHQLRTPLTGLRVTLEAARLDPTKDRDATLDAALSEIDRLDRTIDDLLTLARETQADRRPIDIAGALNELENDWHGRLAAQARPLRIVVEPHLPTVSMSQRALRQILDVLIDNAVRHGSGVVTVRARSAPIGEVIEVEDEGHGVTGDPERIFDRRTAGSDSHGIGLALARSLAEAEGARLRLERAAPHPVFALFLPGDHTPDDPDPTT
jgi:signal transduction histidine kinase